MKTATILLAISLFFVLALTGPVCLLADDSEAQPATDNVLNSLNRIYGTGPLSSGEASSTGVPMDPAGDITPPAQEMSWSEYIDAIEALNDQLDKGTITLDEHFEAFQNLYQGYNSAQRFENRMIQAVRGENRPMDSGDVQTSVGIRPAQNPQHHHEG